MINILNIFDQSQNIKNILDPKNYYGDLFYSPCKLLNNQSGFNYLHEPLWSNKPFNIISDTFNNIMWISQCQLFKYFTQQYISLITNYFRDSSYPKNNFFINEYIDNFNVYYQQCAIRGINNIINTYWPFNNFYKFN